MRRHVKSEETSLAARSIGAASLPSSGKPEAAVTHFVYKDPKMEKKFVLMAQLRVLVAIGT